MPARRSPPAPGGRPRPAREVALTGAKLLADGRHAAVFALCRPPGHHAAADLYGGYCFLNNAAIAAQYLIDGGAERVAILDVDYHHGNGTQAIFYDRAGRAVPVPARPSARGVPVLPRLGRGDRRRAPARAATSTIRCRGARALRPGPRRWTMPAGKIADYAPDVLLVSLGVDTFKDDPISRFRLESADFTTYGAPHRQARPADPVRDGGRLRGRADRDQRGQRAAGLRGWLTPAAQRSLSIEPAAPGLARQPRPGAPIRRVGRQPAPEPRHGGRVAGRSGAAACRPAAPPGRRAGSGSDHHPASCAQGGLTAEVAPSDRLRVVRTRMWPRANFVHRSATDCARARARDGEGRSAPLEPAG